MIPYDFNSSGLQSATASCPRRVSSLYIVCNCHSSKRLVIIIHRLPFRLPLPGLPSDQLNRDNHEVLLGLNDHPLRSHQWGPVSTKILNLAVGIPAFPSSVTRPCWCVFHVFCVLFELPIMRRREDRFKRRSGFQAPCSRDTMKGYRRRQNQHKERTTPWFLARC